MSFEQPIYSFSYPGGEPPTPTKTPTSPNFFLNSLQTPKQDSRSHGPCSPWSPVFPSTTNAEFKTPTRLSFTTPTHTPVKSSRHSTGQDLETEIASHVHHLSPNPNLPLPPVEQAKQLSSSPNHSLTSMSGTNHFDSAESSKVQKPTLDTSVGTSTTSAGSMQTPPPTSTSTARRQIQLDHVARVAQWSVEEIARRASLPPYNPIRDDHAGLSTSQVEESPQQFSALQFSPEGFGFPMSGAATAPVYPQHKLFWDPEQGSDSLNMDFAMDDSFATFGMPQNPELYTSAEDLGSGVHFSPHFKLLSPSNDNLAAFPSTFPESSSHTATSITMARKPSRGHAVNPSLLFSSPSRTAEVSNAPPTAQTIQDDTLKPYALQLRDAQIEMGMENTRRSKRKRGPESGDSPAVKAAIQTLREDGVDRAKVKGDVSTLGEQLSTKRTKSRNSSGDTKDDHTGAPLPLHKQRSKTNLNLHPSLRNPQTHKRTSVTLTIDASGRAKTETTVMDDARPASRMEVNSDDSSDTSSSSSSTGMVMSQPQSFAYPSSKQKQPSSGRFTSDSKSHSQKSSYTSTKGTSAPGHAPFDPAGKRRQSNLYMQQDDDESEADTVMETDDDRGDAQSELKKIIRSRSSHKKNSKRTMRSEPKNPVADQRRTHQTQDFAGGPYYMHNSMTPGQRGYNDRYSNISPTTITDPDLATPSTGRSNLSNGSVRCRCQNSRDDGRLMIQCESCRKWQHVDCLPLDPQRLPAVHLCAICIGSTPNVRVGRVREPARAAFPPPSSPLAHKSSRFQ